MCRGYPSSHTKQTAKAPWEADHDEEEAKVQREEAADANLHLSDGW